MSDGIGHAEEVADHNAAMKHPCYRAVLRDIEDMRQERDAAEDAKESAEAFKQRVVEWARKNPCRTCENGDIMHGPMKNICHGCRHGWNLRSTDPDHWTPPAMWEFGDGKHEQDAGAQLA